MKDVKDFDLKAQNLALTVLYVHSKSSNMYSNNYFAEM